MTSMVVGEVMAVVVAEDVGVAGDDPDDGLDGV